MYFAAGVPEYSMAPGDFAETLKQCRENGADLLGGCCGTAPEYIAAMVSALGGKK